MRSNQVNIKVERFSDNEKIGVTDLQINVYADANNVYEALAAGYFEVLLQLQEEGNIELPVFGRREHYSASSISYNKIFNDFLKQNRYEEKWQDFKKTKPILEEQFLEEENILEKFKLYRKDRIKK